MLADEGALIIKFWMHLSRDQQKKRLKTLEKDPQTRWRVSKRDWEHFKIHDRFRLCAERSIRHTSTAEAPWIIVDGSDQRYRSLTVGKVVLETLRKRLDDKSEKRAKPSVSPLSPSIDKRNVLRSLDMSQGFTKKQYAKQVEKYQERLARLVRAPKFKKSGVIAVFEGNDAAGKGGAIRRLTRAMDARNCRVVSTAAPNDEERARPYLWRFWRGLPRLGRVTIYDRSWYGRVLVERLEGFCRPEDWKRAYGEINAFEEELSESGVVIVKYWLAISQEEQLKRFKERQATPYKQYKITEEDWRNRAKWGAYEAGACDMIEKTSTSWAPWVLVEGNDKRWARVKVLRSACEKLEEALQ